MPPPWRLGLGFHCDNGDGDGDGDGGGDGDDGGVVW